MDVATSAINTTEVHHLFYEVPGFGSSRPLPKVDLEKK